MNWDWSEQWLQEAAGWRVVKDAKRFVAANKVEESKHHEGILTGLVIAGKTHKVRIIRKSKAVAEVVCSCLENRKNGTFCEHAAAVVLSYLQNCASHLTVENHSAHRLTRDVKTVATKREESVVEKMTTFRIELPPQWCTLIQRGRLSVKLEVVSSEANDSDKRLFAWLKEQGIKDCNKTILLALDSKTIVSFFAAISHHPRMCSRGNLVSWKEVPALPFTSQKENDRLILSLPSDHGWTIFRNGSLLLSESEIVKMNDGALSIFVFTLIAEKYIEISLKDLFYSQSIQEFISESEQGSWLKRWQQKIIKAQVEVMVFGTMEKPQIRVSCKIGEQKAPAHGELIRCNQDELEVCDLSQLEICQTWFKKMNWQRVGETDVWKSSSEHTAIHFWEIGLSELEKLADVVEFAPPLKDAVARLNRVETRISTIDLANGTTELSLGFSTSSGKDLHTDKILQLLRSGKRLIQTNDGSSLLLPKESWEAFQATIDQADWKQTRGCYIIQKGQKRLLREIRKNLSNSIDDEQYTKSDNAKNSIAKLSSVTLRQYQEDGIFWLHDRLEDEGFALLADEMGLGKTLQSIALLATFAKPDVPALVVMPTSLLGNWTNEIQKFQRTIKTYVHHGDRRDASLWPQYSVIVTSYKVLSLDRASFLKQTFSLVILDEASLIRNPDTDAARACFRLSAQRRLALTGTPVENQLRDLWSIFQFLQAGYLGERKSFEQRYCGSLTNQADRTALLWRTRPYILRRTKALVAKDLPEKIEIDEWCELSDTQHKWYRELIDQGSVLVDHCETDAQARMKILTLILRLRQTCCDLALLDSTTVEKYSLEQRSSKLTRLIEIVNECLLNGSKVLVFSQFSKQLHLISAVLSDLGIANLLLDGSSTNRSDLVSDFQRSDGPSVFLVSLKAGGYGLNLTAADTVILYEPWWNPAVEKQAMDRAHRIGQMKTVSVYRLLTRGTMEERVKKFQATKNDLMDAVMDDATQFTAATISVDEIREIFDIRNFS